MSLLLGHVAKVAPFVAPFRRRQASQACEWPAYELRYTHVCMNACMPKTGTCDGFEVARLVIRGTTRSERNTRPQVTGSILQCMDQVDDVREYLPDEAANLVFVRRLLTWLKPFQRDLSEKKPDIVFHQPIKSKLPCFISQSGGKYAL